MSGSSSTGCAPVLAAAICVAVVFAVFRCSGDSPPAANDTRERKELQAPKTELDLTQPIQTSPHAIVCDQDLLLAARISRAADNPINRVYDAFFSVINRTEKVREAGCEEWRGGIRVFHVHQMKSPFDSFIAFGLTPNGMAEHFTMKAHLENLPRSSDTNENHNAPGWTHEQEERQLSAIKAGSDSEHESDKSKEQHDEVMGPQRTQPKVEINPIPVDETYQPTP